MSFELIARKRERNRFNLVIADELFCVAFMLINNNNVNKNIDDSYDSGCDD